MFIRKAVTALALLAACSMLTFTIPTSADAAQISHVSAQVAPNRVVNHQGKASIVGLTLDDNAVGKANAIGAITELSFKGHFNFRGPGGYNENEPPRGEKQYSANQGELVEFIPPKNAPTGSFWCVTLYQFNSPGNYTTLDDNCVKVP
ncbi:hypothetical protein GCM10009765_55480 [Fodinicola feengrottensis]|uniref:Lipoprotein n=1 Tax=Fodinicola feengrottensis TaxID=435914 RepID=A0ABN2I5Q2_9ACTN